MLDPQFAALSYIKHVLDDTGLSPSALAKKAGVSATTITRPINNPNHKYAISTSTISKIASSTGINPAPFFETSNIARQQREIIKEANIRRPIRKVHQSFNGKNEFLIPVGVINTGDWRENDILNPLLFQPILLTHSWFSHDDTFAVAVIDEKANRLARPGEFLICSGFAAGKQLFGVSRIVIVQKLADGGRLIQLSACYAEEYDGGWGLYPTTDLPEIREPFVMLDLESEFEGMQVIGIVQYVVRPPRLLDDA